MTFLQLLQSHKGSLIRLKTQLFWYGGRGYDKNPGRICLILDVPTHQSDAALTATARGRQIIAARSRTAGACLLIEEVPQLIWLVEEDVEFI
jgi:hypothetical protein